MQSTEGMKTCRKCGRSLPSSEFNRNRNSADGLQDTCRRCFSEYNRARYKANPERFREAARRRREEHPESDYETRMRACAKSPTQKNAHMAVDAAVRAGVIERPRVCSGCGCTDAEHRIEAHHHDYARPLDVIWLCTPCHRRMDMARREHERCVAAA